MVFFGGGAYGSLPDAAICDLVVRGGVLTSQDIKRRVEYLGSVIESILHN